MDAFSLIKRYCEAEGKLRRANDAAAAAEDEFDSPRAHLSDYIKEHGPIVCGGVLYTRDADNGWIDVTPVEVLPAANGHAPGADPGEPAVPADDWDACREGDATLREQAANWRGFVRNEGTPDALVPTPLGGRYISVIASHAAQSRPRGEVKGYGATITDDQFDAALHYIIDRCQALLWERTQ